MRTRRLHIACSMLCGNKTYRGIGPQYASVSLLTDMLFISVTMMTSRRIMIENDNGG